MKSMYVFLEFFPYMVKEYDELIFNKYGKYFNHTNTLDYILYDYVLNKRVRKIRKEKLKKINEIN